MKRAVQIEGQDKRDNGSAVTPEEIDGTMGLILTFIPLRMTAVSQACEVGGRLIVTHWGQQSVSVYWAHQTRSIPFIRFRDRVAIREIPLTTHEGLRVPSRCERRLEQGERVTLPLYGKTFVQDTIVIALEFTLQRQLKILSFVQTANDNEIGLCGIPAGAVGAGVEGESPACSASSPWPRSCADLSRRCSEPGPWSDAVSDTSGSAPSCAYQRSRKVWLRWLQQAYDRLTYVEARSGAGSAPTEAAPPQYLGDDHSRQSLRGNTQATAAMDLPSAQGLAIRPRAVWNRIKRSPTRSPTRQTSRARRTRNSAGSPPLLRPSSRDCGRLKAASTCRYSARLSMPRSTAQRSRRTSMLRRSRSESLITFTQVIRLTL